MRSHTPGSGRPSSLRGRAKVASSSTATGRNGSFKGMASAVRSMKSALRERLANKLGAGAERIALARGKRPWPREENRRDDGHVEVEILALPPEEELPDAVHLIVVSAVGEGQELRQKFRQPTRVLGHMHVARLNLRRLGGHAFEFAAIGANTDRA